MFWMKRIGIEYIPGRGIACVFPVYSWRTFVIGKDGSPLSPSRVNDLPESLKHLEEGCVAWEEEWEVPDDALAVEVLCSIYGKAFGVVYVPRRCSIRQIFALESLLSECGLSLCEGRDDVEQAMIMCLAKKSLDLRGDYALAAF